ncbi:MAG: ABC transporter ATP-binding protein, partial [Vulcanimicrobiaceae bacterium]
ARAGTILLDATPLGTMRPRARARAVALIESEPEVAAELRVLEIVRTGRFARRAWWDWTADPEDDAAARTALAAVELAGFGERRIGELSSGERRRVWLALALAQEAHLVLLDEPTAHLDPRHALETICTIRGLVRRGAATIAVFHDLNEAALVADRIALVAEGGFLACDRPERALDPALLERAYGVAFERIIVEGRPRVFVGRAPRATAVS